MSSAINILWIANYCEPTFSCLEPKKIFCILHQIKPGGSVSAKIWNSNHLSTFTDYTQTTHESLFILFFRLWLLLGISSRRLFFHFTLFFRRKLTGVKTRLWRVRSLAACLISKARRNVLNGLNRNITDLCAASVMSHWSVPCNSVAVVKGHVTTAAK